MSTRLGVDVGGTFTDVAAFVDGELRTAKVPSTPEDQSRGAIEAIDVAELEGSSVEGFAHGMTVATNALLERRGARAALITTEGFRDLLEIGRQDRPSLYDLTARRPAPLVPRERRFCVRERMGPDGVIVELDEASLAEAVESVAAAEVEAVAVCLLFAFLHSQHEQAVAQALRERLPDVHVSLSSEVLPEFREYERCATTAADAYLAPRLAAYLRRLAERARDAGLPAPLVMRSSGGVIELDDAQREGAGCVLSGPAGGVVGAAWVAEASGFADVLSFDMGGTSTDVAAIVGGRAQTTTRSSVAAIPIGLPMVDVRSVSAGGGSIAWADAGGALRVGPQSAGAQPGPAAYGGGGEDPTVTDANLFLGYLEDGARLGGSVVLKRELAQEALDRVGASLGLDTAAAALGVIAIANAEMVRALRVITVQRGIDPRGFALLAFGGAGGLHACALADELGCATVLLHRAAGVLSALGLAISDLRRDYVSPLHASLDEVSADRLERAFAEMEEGARGDLSGEPDLERLADLRYRGQAFELTVDGSEREALRERFEQAHDRRVGYRMQDEPVELVAVRVVATVGVPKPQMRAPENEGSAEPTRRRAWAGGAWSELPVIPEAALRPGAEVDGPALVERPDATCLVAEGWHGAVDDAGTLVLERAR
ncbi:MAG: hydantoinase [Solirubrobacterales bacterium]|nr:MAG: hydantoinase [Solirubrobacterales bacterium]